MRPRSTRRLFRFVSRTGDDVRTDVQDEIAFHLEMRVNDLMAEGLSRAEARARAVAEFGDVERASATLMLHDRQTERARWLSRAWSDLRRDIGYGIRLLGRNKGFSTTAILTLAVAIGGNTATFSIVNALFLQPLPVRNPQEMVRIYTGESTASWPNVSDIRARNTVFADVMAQGHAQVSLSLEPLPVRVAAGLVSPNYFDVLGAASLIGRPFQASDAPETIVVVSERLWRSRLGGSATAIGQALTIDGQRREVIGVMPRTFRGIAPPGFARDVWIPLAVDGAHRGLATDRAANRFEVYGRLAPGISIEEATAAMRVVGLQMTAEHPTVNQRFAAMEIFAASGVGLYRGVASALRPVFTFLGFLIVVAAFILIISCANLAGLLIGRAAGRRQEIAVRMALGAGRFRLLRQLLIESSVLALIGGALGGVFAVVLTAMLSRATSTLGGPIDLNVTVDRRVLTYALVVSLGSVILFGLAPSRRATRLQLVDSLKPDGGHGRARQRFRQGLIVSQVTISTLLLFWSGLFARSLLHVNRVDPGFDPSDVLLAEVQLTDDKPDALTRADLSLVTLHERVSEMPGVEHAGWSSIVPLALLGNERFRVSKAEDVEGTPGTRIVASRLSPGWFAAVRIPIVAGRDFTWSDRRGSPPVMIVNQTLARLFWSGGAIGQRIKYGSTIAQVVGIVGDSKYWTIGETTSPTVYLPLRQAPASHALTLHVRTSDPRGTAEGLRQAVSELRAGLSPDIRPMRDAVAVAALPARIGAVVTAVFGALGAVLATLGIYGLISYVVVQRSREVAIRRAIGAPTAHIIRVVMGGSAALATAGVIVGLLLGSVSAPLFGGLLVNVSPRDPLTLTAAAVMVLCTALLASAPAALRAARVNPSGVLKAE
jgi:predicted permease